LKLLPHRKNLQRFSFCLIALPRERGIESTARLTLPFLHPNPGMLFRLYKPGPPLSDCIENFWLYDGYGSPHPRERIFPSGTFELVFNLREDELRIYRGPQLDRASQFSGAIVSGPYGSFFGSDAEEEASVMGVDFKPGGAFPFLGLAADERKTKGRFSADG